MNKWFKSIGRVQKILIGGMFCFIALLIFSFAGLLLFNILVEIWSATNRMVAIIISAVIFAMIVSVIFYDFK